MSIILIVNVSDAGFKVAERLVEHLDDARIVSRAEFKTLLPQLSSELRGIIYVGAMGICVRDIVPLINDKYTDPAVVCVDATGNYAVSVLSGHVGGANALCADIARVIGARPVITTLSDNLGLPALDTMGAEYGWVVDAPRDVMQRAVCRFVNGGSVALLLDVRDDGTAMLERALPDARRVTDPIEAKGCDVLIAVTPFIYEDMPPRDTAVLFYRPRILSLGIGCKRGADSSNAAEWIDRELLVAGISKFAVNKVASVSLKSDEPLIHAVAEHLDAAVVFYEPEELARIAVPTPSEKVAGKIGIPSVAEASAAKASNFGRFVALKQRNHDRTWALAAEVGLLRYGHVEIVGAGPGDPDLISVRGRRFLEQADLILYAGSLVPAALTECAKPGCEVRSSADMTLQEQFQLMYDYYKQRKLIVRLHTGDPCIYGAIQEQMAYFDQYDMSYHITPGISSFQAAAAELRSQFTIPEKVQTIILTRGEGRTPMPEREQLERLAQSRSTMCIYLSAGIVEDVQRRLLEAYPPDTPVAACYKLTWPEQRIYRGQLSELTQIVRDNNLSLTTLLVVGDAIDNREGCSRLYDSGFSHLFRK